MKRSLTGLVLALLVLVGGTLALAAPAQAASAQAAPAQADSQRKAGQKRVSIVFDKNYRNQFKSRIIWKVERKRSGRWRIVDRATWRAGSGLADKWGKKSCVRNHGWLPNGVYGFVHYKNYDGTYINGRAFRLEDKRCRNGTIRQQLFIHTEQTVRNTQCANIRGDQFCRWEYPKINDYRSNGCIKMNPRHLRQLTERYHRHFRSGVRHSTGVVRVVVR